MQRAPGRLAAPGAARTCFRARRPAWQPHRRLAEAVAVLFGRESPPPRAPPPRPPSSGHREGQRGRGQAARGSVELPTNVARRPRGPPARPDRVRTGARGLQCCPRTLACLVSTAPDFPGGLASASSDPSSAEACGEPIGASGHRRSRGPPGASFHLQGRPPPCVSFILTVAPRRGLGGHRSPAAGVPHVSQLRRGRRPDVFTAVLRSPVPTVRLEPARKSGSL